MAAALCEGSHKCLGAAVCTQHAFLVHQLTWMQGNDKVCLHPQGPWLLTNGASSIVICGGNAADVDDVPLQAALPMNPAALCCMAMPKRHRQLIGARTQFRLTMPLATLRVRTASALQLVSSMVVMSAMSFW